MSNLIGKTIGEYQLVQLLAEGDQILHFKAFQPKMDRYVGVALLKPQAAQDPAIVQRFLQTAQIAAQIGHANLLPVYDYGQDADLVYRVSPLLELGTVRDNLVWFHDLHNASRLVAQITNGLEYLYAQGTIHGNLKSSNIYLEDQRSPLLSDFGLSHPPGAQDPYKSPEQVQGGMVDQRTDVYALGVLLYEMLTGIAPPVGIIASPRARRPDLPEAVERVVLKAMAQNPDQRFQNPAQFRDALQNAVQAPVSRPAPVPVSTSAPASGVSQTVHVDQTKSTNWTAIILGVVLVAVIALAAFLIIPQLLEGDDVAIVPPEEPGAPPVEQPTEPPVEPTEPPVEQPTEPVGEQPPDEPGTDPPEEEPGEICASIGLVGGVAFFGVVFLQSKRKRRHGV